ncbi:MAG: GGDEF domain-containing protein [Lachnospiraceae bacterium]|nr:GGDEF domain-containing protein [Lachnospiraceae bacterium]
MDITKYDQKIRDLYDTCCRYLQMSDPRAYNVIKRLEKEALRIGDDALIGNVYYTMAFAEYFMLGRYEDFLKHLQKAARHLLASDKAELGRVYYLVALDALNKGMNDVAANYFLTARNHFLSAGQETSAGIMDDNVGHVLMLIGDYKKSRIYFKRALKAIRRDKSHPHYYSNVSGIYINDGLACLELGRKKEAKEMLQKTRRFRESSPDRFQIGTDFAIALFEARIAADDNNKKQIRATIAQMKEIAAGIVQLSDYAEDFRKLATILLASGNTEAVREILNIIEAHPAAEDASLAWRIRADIRVDYFRMTGDAKGLKAAYREQDEIYNRLRSERGKTFRYAGELIRLITELRSEQEKVQREHEELLHRAQEDALCGIPNRYALNLHFEQAFDLALKEKTPIGIAMMDMDGLKEYNDTYGHPEGDKCLIETGRLLLEDAKEKNYFAARYGGDEFVLIFEGADDERIRTICKSLQKRLPLSVSIGACNRVPSGKRKSWEFLSGADKAMYRAKRSGGGGHFHLAKDV